MLSSVPELRVKPTIGKAIARAVGRSGVDLLVGMDDRFLPLGLPNTVAQVGDQLLQRTHLSFGECVAVEIADEADTKGDVVEVVTGHVAAVDLLGPAIANLDLTVTRAMAVADHEVVSQPVLHVTHSEVVDLKNAGISLTGAAVVDDDIFPSAPAHRSSVDGRAGRGAQVAVGSVRSEESTPEASARPGGSRSGSCSRLKAFGHLHA